MSADDLYRAVGHEFDTTNPAALLQVITELVGTLAQRDQQLADIGFLWDWRINKGMAFLASTEDVPPLRHILAGGKIEEAVGFEWVKEARADDEEEGKGDERS